MDNSNINPYESPRVRPEASDKGAQAKRQALALRAFVYSLIALGVGFLAPLLLFLFLPEGLASDATKNVISVGLCAVFLLGCVANMVALVFGAGPIKAASVPVAILNTVALVRFAGYLVVRL